MQECLGISITDKLIRYAKVQKDNNSFKVLAFGVKFYDNLELQSTIQQIINETDSLKTPVSIDIRNEKYYYFDIFNLANKDYAAKAINTEFESFCIDNHMNRNVYEGRYTYCKSQENSDKNKVIYIYEYKNELDERYNLFPNSKITSATPLSVALPNIAKIEKDKNIMIVNLEDETTITTILNQSIYSVDVIKQGLSEAFDKINEKENSYLKTYEVCKNTTIYTMEIPQSENPGNEYLEYIIPALYKIVQAIQNITLTYQRIDQIYLTGMGTTINNVDLYFQEYFKNIKVEILKPFFLTNEDNTNINMKDYIEVNPAIALGIQGLGYGPKTLNFKRENIWENIKQLMHADVKSLGKSKNTVKSQKQKNKVKSKLNFNLNMAMNGKLEKLEIALIRDSITVLLIIIMYCIGASFMKSQILQKKSEAEDVIKDTNQQIALANTDDSKINDKTKDYKKYKSNLENTSSAIETKRSRKNQITTLLNKLVYTIPKEVQITEIKNTENISDGKTIQHITIYAQATKYEQLAYFKAKLKNGNILDNIVSTEGTKDGEYVKVVIEGDLKTY